MSRATLLAIGLALLAVTSNVERSHAEPARANGKRAPPRSAPGEPFAALRAAELQRFSDGRAEFEAVRTLATGLGPLFNESSCHRCHNRKGVGGAGIQSALLIAPDSGESVEALLGRGGPTLATSSVTLEFATRATLSQCRLSADGEAAASNGKTMSRRRTTPLFGLGLVDATPDDTFIALAARQHAAIRGRAPRVKNLATGRPAIGKFGWKAQAPTLHQFSGLALLMELGVTSPEFPHEQAPFGKTSLLQGCDVAPELEDDGRAVAALTDFVQLLAPVPPLAQNPEARAGDAVFTLIGCDGCHVRSIRSGPSPIEALSNQRYAPFSDFLLHDMGALGDGIAGEGDAGPREMRTAPLWGLHLAGGSRLLHDGRAKSFSQAVEMHEGQGAAARDAFAALSARERGELLAFLATL